MADDRNSRSLVLRYALPAVALALLIASPTRSAGTADEVPDCAKDAMLVFDASGSMTGMGFGESAMRRIEQVRHALAQVLPAVTPVRDLGLMVFGPGAGDVCDNIALKLPPGPNSAEEIMAEVDVLQPYGQTPLTRAVGAAAEALDFRERPAVIVLLTDGEETCRGNPCELGQRLRAQGADVTVHVVGYMLRLASEPTGGAFARCLSEMTGGLFISTETVDELIDALRRTLGCPLFSSANGCGADAGRVLR